jgi:N-acetylneuraminic acid mutarotase
MKIKQIIFFLTVLSICPSFAQNYWIQKDSVNGAPRSVCAAFVTMGQGYVAGGLDDIGFKRKMYSYDPAQNDWDDEESIGGPNGDGMDRGSASAFSIGNKGYVCLGQGQTNPYFKDLWEYNVETGAWTQKADFIGSARRQAIAFAINDFAYVGTGQDATGLKKDFFKYDPVSNTWTQLNDFGGTPRRQAVGFTMGGQGYVGTGDDGILKTDFWMYEPTTDTWTQKSNFPGTARAGAVGWGTFPSAFIATGEDINFEYKKDVWEYNYFTNSWIQRADLSGPGRKNAIAFQIDGIGYVGTGYNGVFLDDFHAYYGIAGIDNKTIEFNSLVYPNPAQNEATIISNEINNNIEITVFSPDGQEITSQINVHHFENNIKLDLSELPPGNYIYKLKNAESQRLSTGKLIKL